jgi:heterodisulfide reductase subunit C
MAIESGVTAAERNIMKFHESFLAGIEGRGRISEPLLMVRYKLKTGDLFSDIVMGLDMLKKGKLSLISPATKDMRAVRKIFEKTSKT